MWKNLPLFPEQASSLAGQVDGLYFFLVAVSAFFTVLIFMMVFVFAVKYRKSAHPNPEQIEGSLPLELTWTLIPLGISMIFFAWGSLIYFQEARPPHGAMEVYAVGKQWMWKFEHETGQREINQLHIPVDRDIKMIMSSQDVIHSFYVPAFRIKQTCCRPLHVNVVPSDQGGHLSPVLRRVLRHGALGHDRRSGGDGADSVSGVAGQRRSLDHDGVEWQGDVHPVGLRHLPSLRYAGPRTEAWLECSASRCNWPMGARSWRTRTMSANPS